MRISSKQKKGLIIGASVLLVLIGSVFAIGMSQRNAYLDKAVNKVKKKLRDDHNIEFQVAQYKFDGLTTVIFDSVTVIPESRDTLVDMSHLGVSIRIWPLLFGEVKIGDLDLDNGKISFVKRDSVSNYDFLFKKKKDSTATEEPAERNFAAMAENLAKQVFAKIPSNMTMRNFEISYQDSLLNQKIRVPEAIIDDGDFETSLFLNEQEAEWILKGNVDSDDQRLLLEVSSKQKDAEIPFLKGKYGLSVSFDKLIFDLTNIKRASKDLLQVNGSFGYENLVINHRRLSDEPIMLPQAKVEGGIEIANDYIALKEGTSFTVKDFVVKPMAKFTVKPAKKLELGIHTGLFKAQNFFDALPKGLFESLDGVEVEGNVSFDLDFAAEFDKPENVLFKSSIDDVDLKVVKWGKANIDSLNFPFVYDAYNDTILARRFVVGPENPNFVPFNQIPYVLRTTVRNTEDPFFYKHNGFEEEAFKLSIATNLKEKKFKRGASTISMQLIKNVFLNRKKTMDRKLEEILLVWLMEASGSVSKDRLLEIYLNVIEWGKNVYGIEEASRYYFDKSARELNLGESLFLSSIIPRPKTGLSSFDHTGGLKPWVLRHFNTYGSIMQKVGDLKNDSIPMNYGFYSVSLKPSLRPKAPVVADTTFDVMQQDADILQEIEVEEKSKKSILDKLFSKEH